MLACIISDSMIHYAVQCSNVVRNYLTTAQQSELNILTRNIKHKLHEWSFDLDDMLAIYNIHDILCSPNQKIKQGGLDLNIILTLSPGKPSWLSH